MSKVLDEQAKLRAGFFNTIGSSMIVAGVVVPLVASSFEISTAPAISGGRLFVICAAWLLAGFLMHYIGSVLLRRMSP